ncbi:transmembrane protein 234 homolog [Stegodyphus dumicola]|uniref:transmembrane protein 234 homolog n=1 Tax=Stegodyphus dumicola TaxID=202533 RepID=UPI0015B15E31|nr:transmembrane protein 234 homolog [Stegodyphus dumicola]XP_035208335.1 transmembrane protein 234 homolog [Stegodyphus dumicola]XP_035208336.1 transmembrane protein 234 homolog [Stegodyphus dumicola]
MVSIASILWLIIVAAIWGLSTPLLRHGSAGIENVSADNLLSQWLAELKFLILNWKYIFPFLINQSGSAVYALALGSAEHSRAISIRGGMPYAFYVEDFLRKLAHILVTLKENHGNVHTASLFTRVQ